MADFVPAWDRRTGQKLTHPVPESHFDIWPDILAPTPQSKRTKSNRIAAAPVTSKAGKTSAPTDSPTAGDESKESPHA